MTDSREKSPPKIKPIRKSKKNSKINDDGSDASSEGIIEYLKLEELSLEGCDSNSSINTELSVENELTPKVDVNWVKSAQGSHTETFFDGPVTTNSSIKHQKNGFPNKNFFPPDPDPVDCFFHSCLCLIEIK